MPRFSFTATFAQHCTGWRSILLLDQAGMVFRLQSVTPRRAWPVGHFVWAQVSAVGVAEVSVVGE